MRPVLHPPVCRLAAPPAKASAAASRDACTRHGSRGGQLLSRSPSAAWAGETVPAAAAPRGACWAVRPLCCGGAAGTLARALGRRRWSARSRARRCRGRARPAGALKAEQDPLPAGVSQARLDFKKFLLVTEAEQPLWYKLSDLYLTFLGGFLFYIGVVEPEVSVKYHLDQLGDIVNVNFFIRFALLYWANDFEFSWLMTGKACLDLVSCLPVLDIPARFMGSAALSKTIDLLQLARFLRLLRDSLPSSLRGSRAARAQEEAPLRTLTVLIALAGTVVLSATLLFLYENPQGFAGAQQPFRSFDDTVLYMVNVFSGRQTPWDALTRGGKQVTVAATVVGTFFLPFLVSEGVEAFMGAGSMQGLAKSPGPLGRIARRFGGEQPALLEPATEQPLEVDVVVADPGLPASVFCWVGVLERIDALERAHRLSHEEALQLRKLCSQQEKWVLVLDARYGRPCEDRPNDNSAWELFADRLREWLSGRQEVEANP